MTQTAVLFVDDDSNVLSGLRRMLYSHRDRWSMQFVIGGEEAIRKMRETPFDVVISDMRMPSIDGVAVLKGAKEYAPAALRCVLSGQSDREQTYRVLETAHQFVSKPCDAKVLETVILKAQELKAKLPLQELKAVTTGINQLPSRPIACDQLFQEMSRESPSIDRIADIVASDIAMSAKVLQLVGSSFFGQPSKVACPRLATRLLGIELMKELVLHRNAFRPFPQSSFQHFALDDLTSHSLEVARCAKIIATYETGDAKIAEEAFMAGMLHDIGKIVLADQFPEEYESAIELSMASQSTLWQAETHIFGTSHAEIGSYLLALWGLPAAIVDAVCCYRQPSTCLYQNFAAVTAVHVANLLKRKSYPNRLPEQELLYASEHLLQTGLAAHIPEWCAAIQAEKDTSESSLECSRGTKDVAKSIDC